MTASDDSLAPTIVGANIAMMAVSTLAMAGRVTVSTVTMRNFWIDDAVSIVSWLCLMALLSLVILMTTVGFGSHFDTISPDMLEKYIAYGLPTFFLYIWGSTGAKLAYAFYYLRLFSDRRHAIFNKGIIVFLFLQGLADTFSISFLCTPLTKALVPTIPGKCANVAAYYLSFFAIKIISDFVLFVQPLPVLWSLRLSIARKSLMFVLVSIGMFVCVFSVVRIMLVPALYNDGDPTYDISMAMLWSEIEVFSLIVCHCVPSLRTLGKRIGPVVAALVFATQQSKSNHTNNDDQAPGASGGSSRRKHRRGKWRNHRGSRNSSKLGGTGGSSGSSRGSRFGVTSLVSATRRSDSDFAYGQSSVQTIAGKNIEPPEPAHGTIMVTRDIEIGIEVAEGTDEDEDDDEDEGNEDDDYDEHDDGDNTSYASGSYRHAARSSLSVGGKAVEPLEAV